MFSSATVERDIGKEMSWTRSKGGCATLALAARAVAGNRATDALLLQIALKLADQGQRLDANVVGKLGRRLAPSAADIEADQLPVLIERELRGLQREDAAVPRSVEVPDHPHRT